MRCCTRAHRSTPGAAARTSASVAAGKHRKRHRGPTLHGNPLRALLAYRAMQKVYYVPGSGLYEGEPFSYLWPFSQAMAATVSMSNVPHLGVSFAHELRAQLIGLDNYLDIDNAGAPEGVYTSTLAAFDGTVAPPTGPGGAKYYDDNDWVGIELARLYRLTRNPAALSTAESIMAFEMAGWQSDPALGCPGGLPFSNVAENTDRNTVTTAPAAELALQLYRITANRAVPPVRGNGLRVGASVPAAAQPAVCRPRQPPRHRRTGPVELQPGNDDRRRHAALPGHRATLPTSTRHGRPPRRRSSTSRPNAWDRRTPSSPRSTSATSCTSTLSRTTRPGPKIAQAYVDYAWQNLRLSNNLFVAGSPASAQLLVQAAIVQIYALLCSPPSSYF